MHTFILSAVLLVWILAKSTVDGALSITNSGSDEEDSATYSLKCEISVFSAQATWSRNSVLMTTCFSSVCLTTSNPPYTFRYDASGIYVDFSTLAESEDDITWTCEHTGDTPVNFTVQIDFRLPNTTSADTSKPSHTFHGGRGSNEHSGTYTISSIKTTTQTVHSPKDSNTATVTTVASFTGFIFVIIVSSVVIVVLVKYKFINWKSNNKEIYFQCDKTTFQTNDLEQQNLELTAGSSQNQRNEKTEDQTNCNNYTKTEDGLIGFAKM